MEPEPLFVISAPAPGGNLISAPRLSAPVPQDFEIDPGFTGISLILFLGTK